MAKNPRRIPEEKVFVTKELSKAVTTLTLAQVIQHDHRGMLQVSRDIENVFKYHYRKLNDRQSR